MNIEQAIKSIKVNMPDQNRYPTLYDALEYAIDYMKRSRSVDDPQRRMTIEQAINYWLQHESVDDKEQSDAVWCAIKALKAQKARAEETIVDQAFVNYLEFHKISLEEYDQFDYKAQEFIANTFFQDEVKNVGLESAPKGFQSEVREKE